MKMFHTILIVLLAVPFVVDMGAILQHGPLPQATLRASGGVVLLLMCGALRVQDRLAPALVIGLVAFPGILISALILNDAGTFSGLSDRGYAAVGRVVTGMSGAGAIGLLYLAALRLWRLSTRSARQQDRRIEASLDQGDVQ